MQAFDSARLSLGAFKERARFALDEEEFSRRRRNDRKDITSAIKTVLWFNNLRARSRLSGPYELERRFEPDAFRRNRHGEPFRVNKWHGYSKGWHEPKLVLAAVEDAYPGANDCLRSPVWPALVAGPLEKSQIEELLRKLRTPIQELIRSYGLWPVRAGSSTKLIDGNLASSLERRASLDALAAELLLLRRCHAEGSCEAAYQWGHRLWRMMMLLSPHFLRGGIARSLAELVEERVVPMADLAGVCFGFPPDTYVKVAEEFLWARDRTRRSLLASRSTVRQQRAIDYDLLEGQHGWDYHFAFNPVPLIANDVYLLGFSGAALREARHAEVNRHCHAWGLNMLCIGRHAAWPPDAVWTGEDLWARSPDPMTLWGLKSRTHWRAVG